MEILDKLLLVLPLAILVGVPGYIFFRERMVRRGKTPNDHSGRRVFKLTGINLTINSLAAVYFFVIFIILASKIGFNTTFAELGLAIFFMLTIGVTYYGNGIYITSIVLEDYTMPELRSVPWFKTQFIATHLFHGPISHILIYSGWLLIFLALALLDLSGVPVSKLSTQTLLIIGGALVGAAYAGAQIYNGTAPYQFWVGFFALALFLTKLLVSGASLAFYPLGLFFISVIILFETVLSVYFAVVLAKGKKINWDGSGY